MSFGRRWTARALGAASVVTLFAACSAAGTTKSSSSAGAGTGTGGAGGGIAVGAGGATACEAATVCVGNAVHDCVGGSPGAKVKDCDGAQGQVCSEGACKDACAVAEGAPSNLGCEFWAVDLPNEHGFTSAANEPWGIALSNAGESPAKVTIERNDAPFGEAAKLSVVKEVTVGPGQLLSLLLPQAEVNGLDPSKSPPPEPPGTWLSSNAFRIRATAPVVAYQFNVFTNSYSNDASLLLPTNGLGTLYRVIGYPTANPIAPIPVPGVPDRSHVTIVAATDGTSVTVTPSTTTVGDGKNLKAMKPGESATVTLNAFEVLNVASDGIPGDLTGTVVSSNKPVAVFTSLERGIGPALTDPPKPPNFNDSNCCTDHLEEQLFPVSSLGKRFVVTRSPVRSDGGYKEPDELRFLGVAENAVVKTNLPPPFDNFTLSPGESKAVAAFEDVVVDASAPITIAQIQVSAGYTTTYIGDPSLTIFPPIEQYRDTYLFLIPASWTKNYYVLGGPKGASYTIDGKPPAGCLVTPAGTLSGIEYESMVCGVAEGVHRVHGDKPFGLTVYGYGSVGSYAYSGGADVEPIYVPPPIN